MSKAVRCIAIISNWDYMSRERATCSATKQIEKLNDSLIQRYFAHGETSQEALKDAQEVLELLIESYHAEGQMLPQPQTLQTA